MKVVEKKSIMDKILDEKMRYAAANREIDYILLTEEESAQLHDELRAESWWHPMPSSKKKAQMINHILCYGILIKVEGLE